MGVEPTQQLQQGRIIPQVDGPERHSVAVGGGQAEVYCAISPLKDQDNQDSAFVVELGKDCAVLAVADGAGGIAGGRKASRLALHTIRDALRGYDPSGEVLLRTAVMNAIEAANQEVMLQTRGAATTLTLVSIEGREARAFHVGDSIALICGQRNSVKLQTVAHSPVGFAVAAGFLSEEEAMFHGERNIVSNFMGTQEMIIEVGAPVKLAKFDTVLLASDGLADNLHMVENLAMMRGGSLDKRLDDLIALASGRMRRKNTAEPSKCDDLVTILYSKR